LYGFVMAGVVAGRGATGQSLGGNPPGWFFFAVYLSYIPFLIGFSFVQVYIFVSLFNYNLGQLLQGKTYFSSEVKIGKFYWITITNLLASVLSLGLLFPWAAVRKARYMMDCISVVHPGAELD